MRALCVGLGIWAGAAFGQESIDLECPCRLQSSASSATVTLAVRNFRTTDSGALRVEIRAYEEQQPLVWEAAVPIAVVPLNAVVLADALLEQATYRGESNVPSRLDADGKYKLVLGLQEWRGNDWAQLDLVRLAEPVDLPPAVFEVGDLDYLADADGDGVGDINERLAGTDPDDADSTPGPVEVDVLAMHNHGFAKLYDYDPYTRIRHVMSVASEIFRDSGTGILLRLVGVEEAEVAEDEHAFSVVDAAYAEQLRLEYGADLVVMFRSYVVDAPCGWAGLGGYGARGFVSLEENGATYATVFGECGGTTTAHEIGHLMGLHHSARQASNGAFRWSRGHYVDESRGTVMSYGQVFNDRFSDPGRDCDGLPCGKAIGASDGAHSVASLNAVRFHIADFAPARPDRDADGIIDAKDAFAEDATEWRDTDGDGTGNAADTDDDGDGVSDGDDKFPLDPSENADADGDGVGDNADAFPEDATETEDADGDGVGDYADAFPGDAAEWQDTDGDGVGDNGDLFPENPYESSDTDGDGVGDYADADADGDGVDGAWDVFPLDPLKTDLASYLIRGEQKGDGTGAALATGDFDDDGVLDYVVAAPFHDFGGVPSAGAVYLISGARLADADAADGTVDRVVDLRLVAGQRDSWKFIGATTDERAGHSIAVGDWSGDGREDLVIGAPYRRVPGRPHQAAGAVYLVDGSNLARLDDADGQSDGVVELANIADSLGSWHLHGIGNAQAGVSVGIAGRLDDGGEIHVVVGAGDEDRRRGAAYVVSTAWLEETDAADGKRDGIVQLAPGHRAGAWQLRGEEEGDYAGGSVAVGDLDGDGLEEAVVRAAGHMSWQGAVYVVRGDRLSALDATDGEEDGVVELARVAADEGSWRLIGDRLYSGGTATVAHLNDDVQPNLLLAGGSTYVVSNVDLGAADAADGTVDGVAQFADIIAQPNSYAVWGRLWAIGDLDGDWIREVARTYPLGANRRGETYIAAPTFGDEPLAVRWSIVGARPGAQDRPTVSTAGDFDGDGLADLLLGLPGRWRHRPTEVGEVYVVSAADLAVLDRVDGAVDRQLLLNNVVGDADRDGIGNTVDVDDDGDGVTDFRDAFPLDASEWADADLDGVGDNGDAFPEDGYEQTDTDSDGVGDRADDDDDGDGVADSEDEHPLDTDNDGVDNADDDDDDNDGVADSDDDLPLDADETEDTDRDGIGNRTDADDDGDGVDDIDDAFPLNAAEWTDADGDGVGDNADEFPDNGAEWADADGDGIGDQADADDDNDGVTDADDAFPLDAAEWADADGDGVGDNADAFPGDAGESADLDADGIGDNADRDDDSDGVADADDLFPRLAAKSTLTSYRLVGEATGDRAGDAVASLLNGGSEQLVIGAPNHESRGAVYAIAASRMSAADVADGRADRQIDLRSVAGLDDSWKLLGEERTIERLSVGGLGRAAASAGDVDGDGRADLVLGAPGAAITGGALGTAYVVAAKIAQADAADGRADGVIDMGFALDADGLAWKLGRYWNDMFGWSLSTFGSTERDSGADIAALIFGAPGFQTGGAAGAVEVVPARELQAEVSELVFRRGFNHWGKSWRLVGENAQDQAGFGVASGDVDGDGLADILIGAPSHSAKVFDEGAAYLLSSASLQAADDADGGTDRVMELAHVANLADGWKFVGEKAEDGAGVSVSTPGDIDGDGVGDILIGTKLRLKGRAAYLVSGTRLSAADEADGRTDSVVDLGLVASLADCWKFVGNGYSGSHYVSAAGDADGDGVPDLLIRGEAFVYLISGATLASVDSADGRSDGVVELEHVAGQPGSWMLVTGRFRSAEGVGDLDGDGFPDLAFGVQHDSSWRDDRGAVYFVSATDLPILDAADGTPDGIVNLNVVHQRAPWEPTF